MSTEGASSAGDSRLPVLVVSQRYADDVGAMVAAAGMAPRIERRLEAAVARLEAEPMQLVVVDARGALPMGIAAAQAFGPLVEGRQGAMLVLLSRGDGSAGDMMREAGASHVLVAPFGTDGFANTLRLAVRQVERLARAAVVMLPARGFDGDRLTRLATGPALESWLAASDNGGAVIALGVARFAQINTAYGRDVADRLLATLARRLSALCEVPPQGVRGLLLARLAAAEFAIGVSGPVADEALVDMAARLLGAFDHPFAIDDRLIRLAGRAGMARDDGTDDPVHHASRALAIARGREAVEAVWFDPAEEAMDPALAADLATDLFTGLNDGSIHLLFQPVQEASNDAIIGAEALVRWQHPRLGPLSATMVLATAQAAGMGIALGRHLRATAFATAAGWTGPLADLSLSVNVTGLELADPDFLPILASSLAKAGLPPGRLVVEVTEEAVIENLDAASEVLAMLRRDGVRVVLDDFGTGYSSLARLARLPVDGIKLDQVFTTCLTGTERERIVVEAVVATAHRLGLAVTAEGVEDDLQRSAAIAVGCRYIQGFAISPPISADAFVKLCVASNAGIRGAA
jgi:EAL domain-containing protein (putative c-di-GMP-specific phosphodiesterase class I)/GGDEF domain-containing protein